MASTYSPALRLELMATGDQSGTWGDTTNTNLGTLLEQAITGYLSVAQGDVANLTLTEVNGGTDQARNAVVEITGALTATRNVVVQTAEKLYTIKNSTTGGFSIVAKTTAGTGISIPPGASIDCYSDGTNVVAAANYWNGQIGGAVYLDAGATVGPAMDLFRDSTSPAASDVMGQVVFNGRDSAGNKQEYASIEATILDTTSTSEDGTLDFYATVAGTRTKLASVFSTGMTVSGTLTSTGAFTSIGIDDNATGERLQLADTLMTLGTASAAYTIAKPDDNSSMNIWGGSSTGGGSQIILHGASEASVGLDVEIKSGSNQLIYYWDDSVDTHVWYANAGTQKMGLTSAMLYPTTSDGVALGGTANMWSDLFLASGGVINWNNGDVTITHSSNALAFAGASSGYSFDAATSISSTAAGTLLTLTSTDAGVNQGPDIELYRNSASAAAADFIGTLFFYGTDSIGSKTQYARLLTQISDPTNGSEDGLLYVQVASGGTENTSYIVIDGGSSAVQIPLGQLKFPATQNPSSDANTLDDYEEGTFTPELNFGGAATGITYSSRAASYTKIGRFVSFQVQIVLTNNGSATGAATITGLPFSAGTEAVGLLAVLGGGSGVSSLFVTINGSTLFLRSQGATAYADLTDTNLTDTVNFAISGNFAV